MLDSGVVIFVLYFRKKKRGNLNSDYSGVFRFNDKTYTQGIWSICKERKLEEYIVQYPWHGSRFDIRSGEVVRPPAMKHEPTYEVKIENNDILIKKQKENR